MTSESLKSEVEASLPVIWIIALITAVVSAVPIALSRDSAPHLIMYPVLIGGAICVIVELFRKRSRATAHQAGFATSLETFGSKFQNFAGFRELAVVELTIREPKTKQQADAQLELGFLFEQKRPSVEKFRIFRTPDGKQLIALDCDRFSAMLTSEALESFDRSFEKSLEATLLRFAGSSIPKEHFFALTNETSKDILKSDIRGNLATYLAKTNDHLFKRVLEELRRASPENVSTSTGSKVVTSTVAG